MTYNRIYIPGVGYRMVQKDSRMMMFLKEIAYRVIRWFNILSLTIFATIVVADLIAVFALIGKETSYEAEAAPFFHDTQKETPAILKKIAQCESGSNHIDPKTGQVLINKTRDIGKYQINVQHWGKKAAEMGLNLYVEEDNETFALWLLENYGSEPWYLSSKCFSK